MTENEQLGTNSCIEHMNCYIRARIPDVIEIGQKWSDLRWEWGGNERHPNMKARREETGPGAMLHRLLASGNISAPVFKVLLPVGSRKICKIYHLAYCEVDDKIFYLKFIRLQR